MYSNTAAVCSVETKSTSHVYPIILKENILADLLNWIKNFYLGQQIVIVTDKTVNKLYVKKIQANFKKHYKLLSLVVNPGEISKNARVKEELELKMLKHKFDRDTLCIAIGGGVIGDLTGFLAATYMRGIKYIQVPTTLLSMVDSSIGGKTSIDTKYGKNLIGAIWQPQAVLMDTTSLTSLPNKQLINGLFEAIKTFLIRDKISFHYLQKNLVQILAKDPIKLNSVIQRSVKIKAEVVSLDERENNLRAILNFGHTIGHAIEQFSEYKMLHGYAIALGMLVEAKIANIMGFLSIGNYNKIVKLLAKLGINSQLLKKIAAKEIIKLMLNDKKNKGNKIYCVFLSDIGNIYTKEGKYAHYLPKNIINQAFKELKELK